MTFPITYDSWPCPKEPCIALYGLFKEENGTIKGFVERSFWMEWSEERVRQFTLKDALHSLKSYRGKKHNPNVFLYRLTRTNGPIQVDWESHTKECIDKKCSKLFARNPKFSIRPCAK